MANIPVERKGGSMPWWAWLLALLVVAGLIWLVAEMADDEPDAEDFAVTEDTLGVTEPTDPYATTPAATDTITDLSGIWTARQQGSLYGREVHLTDVRATDVAGDSTFFIRNEDSAVDPDDAEARLLVVLADVGESETYAPGPEGSDGRYDINEGEVVNIEGRVDRFRGTERQVTGQNSDRLAPDSLFINAQRVTSDEDRVRSQQ